MLARGCEFRAVVMTACDCDDIPLQERIESVADDTDLCAHHQSISRSIISGGICS